MNENNAFHYTYSAAQNREVQNIRRKYLPGRRVRSRKKEELAPRILALTDELMRG